MSKQEDKVKSGAAPYLEPGEDVLAAVIARPRGWTTQMAGGGAGLHIGGAKVGQANAAGQSAGLELASSLPVAAVDDITLSRLALGKIIHVHAGGDEIKLEVNAKADSSGISDSFAKVKAGG